MTPVALLAEVLARGVEVIPTDRGTIRVRPVSRLTPELLDQLRQHKPEILVLLTQSQDARAGSVRLLVAERAAVFHALVEAHCRELGEEWAHAKHLPIPPLSLPCVVAAPGSCDLCGEPLSPGCTYRCSPCVEAVNLMLAGLAKGA